jgi:hypothetical protein
VLPRQPMPVISQILRRDVTPDGEKSRSAHPALPSYA